LARAGKVESAKERRERSELKRLQAKYD